VAPFVFLLQNLFARATQILHFLCKLTALYLVVKHYRPSKNHWTLCSTAITNLSFTPFIHPPKELTLAMLASSRFSPNTQLLCNFYQPVATGALVGLAPQILLRAPSQIEIRNTMNQWTFVTLYNVRTPSTNVKLPYCRLSCDGSDFYARPGMSSPMPIALKPTRFFVTLPTSFGMDLPFAQQHDPDIQNLVKSRGEQIDERRWKIV